MTTRSDLQRRAQFDRGSLALRRLQKDETTGYMCPLCLRVWSEQALARKLLTLDHVPPKSQGGKTVVLTCHECNNISGHALESHVDAVEDAVQFAKRTMRTPRPFALRWRNGQKINVELLADESGIQIFGLPNHNPPGTTAQWEADLSTVGHTTGAGFDFEVTARRRFNYRSARVGWLKSAYLVAFAALGYSYILLPQLDPIREQIARPTEPMIEGFTVFRSDASAADRALLLIDDPEVALAVVMGHHIVLLPSDDSPKDLYARLSSHSSDRFRPHPIGEIAWPRTLVLAMDFAADDSN